MIRPRAKTCYLFNMGLLIVALAVLQASPSFCDDRTFLSASSRPSIAIGVEYERFAFSVGTDFRWYSQTLDIQYNDITPEDRLETNEIFVLRPAISMSLLSRSNSLTKYFILSAGKDIPLHSSSTGHEENDAYGEYLESQNSSFWVSGALGVRTPISEKLSLGGEFGAWYRAYDVELDDNNWSKMKSSGKNLDTFFRLVMYLYL